MRKMAVIFLVVLIIGVTILEAENVFLFGWTFAQLLSYNIPAVLIGSCIIHIILMAITSLRLRNVFAFWKGGRKADVRIVFNRLYRFPYEIFWGMVILSVLFSFLFHGFEFIFEGYSLLAIPGEEWVAFLRNFLGEQALALTLAILLFTMIRKTLRPYQLSLQAFSMDGMRKATFFFPLAITYFSGFLIVLFNVFRYVFITGLHDEPFDMGILAGSSGFYFALSAFLLFLITWEFRLELQAVIQGIHALAIGDRSKLRSKIPVISRDESGQLAVAFNKLQDRLTRENEELEKELQLAYNVQQKLLPAEYHEIGGCRIACLWRPDKDIGGDLYDVVQLDGRRFAVLIGDVSGKGLPAALLMSATIVLFRTEIRRGGDAGDVLSRLNRALFQTIREGMYITLGLAIIETGMKRIQYASAGHVSPYLSRGGFTEQVAGSSLPIGISEEESYQSVELPFGDGDRFILYTDGVIEIINEQGEMFGFERFEERLRGLNLPSPLPERLHSLAEQLPQSAGAKYHDDRTIVIIERAAS